ncbi:hypothetical protein MHYP_G00252400 [Metynnis hypsauchen]
MLLEGGFHQDETPPPGIHRTVMKAISSSLHHTQSPFKNPLQHFHGHSEGWFCWCRAVEPLSSSGSPALRVCAVVVSLSSLCSEEEL